MLNLLINITLETTKSFTWKLNITRILINFIVNNVSNYKNHISSSNV